MTKFNRRIWKNVYGYSGISIPKECADAFGVTREGLDVVVELKNKTMTIRPRATCQ